MAIALLPLPSTDTFGLLGASTSERGVRSIVTVVGTLLLVALCFVLVELADRGRPDVAAGRPTGTFGPGSPGPTTGTFEHHRGAPAVPRRHALVVAVLATTAVVVLSALMVPLRDEIGTASVVLVLVLVIVAAAAAGGRLAAALTSAAAALAFNFAHTDPLYTFHMRDAADVVTSVLMVLVGVAVGELAQRGGLRSRKPTG